MMVLRNGGIQTVLTRRGAQLEEKENTEPRSRRQNQGKGGHIEQLQKTVQRIRPDLDDSGNRKRAASKVPESAPINPMAPQARSSRSKANCPPLAPTGSEPKLRPAPAPVRQPATSNSMFGFQDSQPASKVSAGDPTEALVTRGQARLHSILEEPPASSLPASQMCPKAAAGRVSKTSQQNSTIVAERLKSRTYKRTSVPVFRYNQDEESHVGGRNKNSNNQDGDDNDNNHLYSNYDSNNNNNGNSDGSDGGDNNTDDDQIDDDDIDEDQIDNDDDQIDNDDDQIDNNDDQIDNDHDQIDNDNVDNNYNDDGHFDNNKIDDNIDNDSNYSSGGGTYDHRGNHPQREISKSVPLLDEDVCVDEVSPDEEERRDHANLRNPKQVVAGQKRKQPDTVHVELGLYSVSHEHSLPVVPESAVRNNSYNVLEAHQKRNRRPRPPSQKRLQDSARQQRQFSHPALQPGNKEDTGADDANKESAFGEEGNDKSDLEQSMNAPPPKRAKRHTKTPHGGRGAPSQMQFYPAVWSAVLEKGKSLMRLFLTLEFPFQDDNQQPHMIHAKTCLSEAMKIVANEGGLVEQGYYPRYEAGMVRLIYEEGSTFRGNVKKTAQNAVKSEYNIFPRDEIFQNQQEEPDFIKQKVKALLASSQYLQGGKDKEGRTNNFSHPGILQVCHDFFYREKKGLGRLYPEYFQDKFPREALALVILAILNALEEWESGHFTNLQFVGKRFREKFVALMKLIERTEDNPYHGPKLHTMLQQIARRGSSVIGSIAENNTDFTVVFD